jgi:hypothetical protein
MRRELLPERSVDARYEITMRNAKGEAMETKTIPAGGSSQIEVPVPPALIERAGGYLQVDVQASYGGTKAPSPAQFHVRARNGGDARLVGVVH